MNPAKKLTEPTGKRCKVIEPSFHLNSRSQKSNYVTSTGKQREILDPALDKRADIKSTPGRKGVAGRGFKKS